MDFTDPQPLTQIVAALDARTPIGSLLRTDGWAAMPQALRDSAFFSAGVTQAQFLAQQQQSIRDLLTRARETNAAGESMWQMDRARFVAVLRQMGTALGIPHPDGPRDGGIRERDITDPLSVARLQLVVNTQLELAYGQGQYLTALDEDILNEWPAWELVRITPRAAERDWSTRWAEAGGTLPDGRMIALKTDAIWARLSRFGKPHPPFDFNSGMGVEEIDRTTAEDLGLLSMDTAAALRQLVWGGLMSDAEKRSGYKANKPQRLQPIVPPQTASVKGLDAATRTRLIELFGDQVEITDDTARWLPPILRPPKKTRNK